MRRNQVGIYQLGEHNQQAAAVATMSNSEDKQQKLSVKEEEKLVKKLEGCTAEHLDEIARDCGVSPQSNRQDCWS